MPVHSRNHNKKTALHFYKNDAIRRSLRQGVGGTNNLLPSPPTDNISREKNKQTTHLKRRNSPSKDRTSKRKPCNNRTKFKNQPSSYPMGSFRHCNIVSTKGYKFRAGERVSRRPYLIS